MKTKLLLTLGFIAVLMACKKDKFTTKPQIQNVTMSASVSNPVPVNGSMTISVEYTDKEGDISDSFYIRKIRINQKKVSQTLFDSIRYKIPDAPANRTGFLDMNLAYALLVSAQNPGSPAVNDTIRFVIKIKDKAKNVSDTFLTEPVVIKRQ
jgi:hypothetical protein